MLPREKFISALERKPIEGRVPHFELVFYLTMEAFGKVHPRHRNYDQWEQMSQEEKKAAPGRHSRNLLPLNTACPATVIYFPLPIAFCP